MSTLSRKQPFFVRCKYALAGAASSFSLLSFGVITALGVLDGIFKWHEHLAKLLGREELPLSSLTVIWIVSGLMVVRAIFLLCERVGLLQENEAHVNGELEKAVKEAKQANDAHLDVFECLHAVIHQTRDCLLKRHNFFRFREAANRKAHLWSIIELQLGKMEQAVRKLLREDCCVVLKVVHPGENGGPATLRSACYSPSTPIGRKESPTVLPLNQGIAYETVVTKSICYCNDITKDKRFYPQKGLEAYAERYRTLVACPVIVNDEVIAVLCFDWTKPDRYDPIYHQVFAAFTDIISAACYICSDGKVFTEQDRNRITTHHPTLWQESKREDK
ncbi:MAG TPA: GAF domain-containing protein [Methylomirabilota bacterium]|nr:GAF domain-containing protein [Methylomirabilota bacterium]